MAKQTFTTGQVLSAAQVNALQANDYNTTVSTKTASYVLVAADVGTTIVQNVATANTVTVNTGLFAAGDTLRIQNIGAGIATVTAGTATVNTANSLALPQWGSGILYFTSASAAIFFPSAGAAAAASSGLVFINSTSFSAASSVSLPTDTFTSTYKNYKIFFGLTAAASGVQTRLRMRAAGSDNTTSNYYYGGQFISPSGAATLEQGSAQTLILIGILNATNAACTNVEITVYNPKVAILTTLNINGITDTPAWQGKCGLFNTSSSFDSMTFFPDAGTITGVVRVFGISES